MRNEVPSSNVGVRAAQLNRLVSRMAHLKVQAVGIALSLLAFAAGADPVAEPATFRELFGVDRSESATAFGAEAAGCMSDALEDFNLVLAAKDPIHAKSDDFSILSDGGTRAWRHACYELTVLKSLTSLQLADGTWIHGYIEGPSLKLKLGPAGSQLSPIARTRFTSLQRVRPNTTLERTRDR
jgi:hypothetical protein